MSDMDLKTTLLGLAVQELPAVISLIKGLFKRQNPEAPDPTDEEVLAAFEDAFVSSRTKDDLWLSTHPADPS